MKIRLKLLPTVTCILAGTDGKVEEVRVTMNEDEPFKKYIGGPAFLLGDWKPFGIMALVCEREEAAFLCMEKSTVQLPKPYDKEHFSGACVFFKTNDLGQPGDFSMEDYLDFTQREPEEWQHFVDD